MENVRGKRTKTGEVLLEYKEWCLSYRGEVFSKYEENLRFAKYGDVLLDYDEKCVSKILQSIIEI